MRLHTKRFCERTWLKFNEHHRHPVCRLFRLISCQCHIPYRAGIKGNNYNCILCCTGYRLEDKQKYLNLLVNKKVDSVILVGSNFIADNDSENDYIREAAGEVPILLLNADFDCENVYCSLL